MANEIVKYNNDLNTVVLKGFTDTELKLFFAVCSKMKDQGTDEVTFTFDQLKNLIGIKKHVSKEQFAQTVQSMYHKLIHLSYMFDDGDTAGEILLFNGYVRSLSEETFTLSVTQKYLYMFNQLTSNFTRFELSEIVNLTGGRRSRLLYRQLKQWRTVGHYSVLIKDLRELLDIPENYEMKTVTSKILNPAVDSLRKVYCFRHLTYKYSKKGNTVVRVIFDWDPEKIPHAETAKEAQSQDISEVNYPPLRI